MEEKELTIQEEVNKIITQYGNSEMCHYKIQLLFDKRLKESQPLDRDWEIILFTSS